MTDKTYTIFDIERAWKQYIGRRILKELKKGKWEWHFIDKKGMPQGDCPTRREVTTIDAVIQFPLYLEKYFEG